MSNISGQFQISGISGQLGPLFLQTGFPSQASRHQTISIQALKSRVSVNHTCRWLHGVVVRASDASSNLGHALPGY